MPSLAELLGRAQSLPLACAFVFLAEQAGAKPDEAAKSLFDEGQQCLDNGNWDCACAKFDSAIRLEKRPSTWVSIGRCRIKDRKYIAAWAALHSARRVMYESPATARPELDAEIESYLARIPTLRIEIASPPKDLVVAVDGVRVDDRNLGPLPLEMGKHQVRATAPYCDPAVGTVDVTAEQAYTLVLDVCKEGPQAGANERRTLGYVLGGVGLVTLATAGVLGWHTLSLVRDSESHCGFSDGSCDDTGFRLRQDASRAQTAGLIAGGIGLASLAGGIYLVVTDPTGFSDDGRSKQAVSARFQLSPGGFVGTVRW